MAGTSALLILPFSPQGARVERQAPMLRDGVLLRCDREAMARKGNDSISEVLFRHHTRSANTV
jgi:hypothetical protein